MGYGLIPLVTSVVLMLHHLTFTDASRGSKLTVVTIVAASLIIWRYYPRWLIVSTLLQSGVSIYLLICLRMQEDGAVR